MSTTTANHALLDGARLSFGGLLRSEWIKLRTLRSTVWCYGLIVVLTVGFGVLLALTVNYTATEPQGPADPALLEQLDEQQRMLTVQVATLGVNFTQLIAAVLGVLVIGGEYGTGMIRSTLTAAPGRLGAYAAKAIVLGVTTLVVGAVGIALTAVVTLPILAAKGLDPQLGSADVLLPMLGGAGYLALVAVLAFAVGAMLRNTAGGLATALGLLLVLPIVLQIMYGVTQGAWLYNVMQFLPSTAGGRVFAYQGSTQQSMADSMADQGMLTLEPWQGLLVLLAWVAVALIGGALLLRRRDA